jgi:hypothetical protein
MVFYSLKTFSTINKVIAKKYIAELKKKFKRYKKLFKIKHNLKIKLNFKIIIVKIKNWKKIFQIELYD